ncbi:hypothetical protein M422DRAFT_262746 [Sphaerobolus stellatus SS14]|uniref:Uncharacterized protein n=1 Tax=Sphaerobolus stellatus (strain SS14) TaxID=990650 RepID=A0A0C9TX62_SPHS4|nr:hypothetical protein M422DRAFT_262746 [Sphaerobolus stellatus SS14]
MCIYIARAEKATKAAAEDVDEEDEHMMDVNLEGEDKVDQDDKLKSKSKSKRKKSCPVVESESKEETKEVKGKRRKVKGKGKDVDTEYKRNTVPIDYVGCPGVPVCKICTGCEVPKNAKYQRPCVANVQMDANDQIFLEDEADFIMPEAANNEELQVKLKKLCDEQDTFQKQKDKEREERNKTTGTSKKTGANTKAENNVKASGSTPKAMKDEEGDPADEEVFSQPEENSVWNLNVVSSLMVEELEDKEEQVEKIHEEVEEVCEEVEGPREEGKEGCEVEDDKTMKDPEGN